MKEKQVFQLIKQIIPDLLDLNEENPFSPIDWYSPGYDTWMEHKGRTKHWDTMTIDSQKYQNLINKKRSRYVVSTPKGVFAWNLKELGELEWHERTAPTSTEYTIHQEIQWCKKTIAYLPIDKATNLIDLLP